MSVRLRNRNESVVAQNRQKNWKLFNACSYSLHLIHHVLFQYLLRWLNKEFSCELHEKGHYEYGILMKHHVDRPPMLCELEYLRSYIS